MRGLPVVTCVSLVSRSLQSCCLYSILALCAREPTWCVIQGTDRPGFCGQEIIPSHSRSPAVEISSGKRAAAATTTPTTARRYLFLAKGKHSAATVGASLERRA
eukprot:665712-Prymnesium_polylepis.1